MRITRLKKELFRNNSGPNQFFVAKIVALFLRKFTNLAQQTNSKENDV